MPADVHVLLVRKDAGSRLGVRLHSDDVTVRAPDAEWRGSDGTPPVVCDVEPGGEAERAGLMVGDEIVSINGQTSLNNVEAASLLRELEGNFIVSVARLPLFGESASGDRYTEGGGLLKVVELDLNKPWADMSIGIEMTSVESDDRKIVVISGVRRRGAADEAGLLVDDVLLSIHTTNANVNDVSSAMEAAHLLKGAVGSIKLRVRRRSESNTSGGGDASPPDGPIKRRSSTSVNSGAYLPRYGDKAAGVEEVSWFARMSRRASSFTDLAVDEPATTPRATAAEPLWMRRTDLGRESFVEESSVQTPQASMGSSSEEQTEAAGAPGEKKNSALQKVGKGTAAAGRKVGTSVVGAFRATGRGIGNFLREIDESFNDDGYDDGYYDHRYYDRGYDRGYERHY